MGLSRSSAAYDAPGIRPLTDGMRWLLLVASLFVLISGVQLFVFSEQTDRFFAWTVQPPLTAAFLGASYWASGLIEFLSSRRSAWARARVAVPAMGIFTTLTLAATLLHLDKFHLNPAATQFATAPLFGWVWLAVYAAFPPAFLILILRQLRVPGGEPPRSAPLPVGLRLVLAAQGAVLLVFGVALLLAPQLAPSLWPWSLTPLTARAIGAWLVGIGVLAVHSVRENDAARVDVGLLSYGVAGLLQLLALARYPATLDWGQPGAWVYLVFLSTVVAVGMFGWLASRGAARRATTTAQPAPPGFQDERQP